MTIVYPKSIEKPRIQTKSILFIIDQNSKKKRRERKESTNIHKHISSSTFCFIGLNLLFRILITSHCDLFSLVKPWHALTKDTPSYLKYMYKHVYSVKLWEIKCVI